MMGDCRKRPIESGHLAILLLGPYHLTSGDKLHQCRRRIGKCGRDTRHRGSLRVRWTWGCRTGELCNAGIPALLP
ncbi:g5895 [Coccomyxa elongata]